MGTLADIVATYVSNHSTRKVDLDGLLRQATAADPTLLGDPTGRARLAAALHELAEAGRIVLPKARTSWDSRTRPPLPNWVMKPTSPKPARTDPNKQVWPQPLEAAAAIATRPDEHLLLGHLATWLRNNPDAEPVPIEERSLEILGDEKALAIEASKRLFTAGALTLDLFACYPTPVPFAAQHVPGVGPTRLLVVENNATFHSLLTLARDLDPTARPDLHIGWGHGNQFPASVAATTLLDPLPTSVYYLGDLDLAGLRTAVNAASAAATRHLPPPRPAAGLYRWLLDHGTPRPDKSNIGTTDPTPLLAWLPDDLHEPVGRLLATRQRIPQETLGLRALRSDPALLTRAIDRSE